MLWTEKDHRTNICTFVIFLQNSDFFLKKKKSKIGGLSPDLRKKKSHLEKENPNFGENYPF